MKYQVIFGVKTLSSHIKIPLNFTGEKFTIAVAIKTASTAKEKRIKAIMVWYFSGFYRINKNITWPKLHVYSSYIYICIPKDI